MDKPALRALGIAKQGSRVQPQASAAKEGSAKSTVEKDVVNSFKAFTANEKFLAQDHQRQAAGYRIAVKLNDVKEFAQSSKLHTPLPQDLFTNAKLPLTKQDVTGTKVEDRYGSSRFELLARDVQRKRKSPSHATRIPEPPLLSRPRSRIITLRGLEAPVP